MTLYIGGFSRVVTFPTAPIATGRSDPCRKGLAPSQEPCLSTAHGYAFGEDALRAEDGQDSEHTLAFKLEPLIRLSS